MSPEIFIDDLYDTFRDNDNPEEFDDQISDFDENLNQPEETRSVSVIVANSPQSSLASPQPSPASLAPGMLEKISLSKTKIYHKTFRNSCGPKLNDSPGRRTGERSRDIAWNIAG